VRVESAVQEMA